MANFSFLLFSSLINGQTAIKAEAVTSVRAQKAAFSGWFSVMSLSTKSE